MLAVEALEAEMLKFPQEDCPVVHRFGPGIYIREVRIPAGTFAIGHYQKTEHLNIFLEGAVNISNDDGTFTELRAPMIFTSGPGRKIGHIIEDMTWLNVYSTTETEIDKLESMFIDKSEAWGAANNLIEQEKKARLEFQGAIEELGFTQEEVLEVSENTDDQAPMPYGSYKFKISNSNIHGKGVIATANIEPEEIIGAARMDGKRTPIGRYTNHSDKPNAEMVVVGNDLYLMAAESIKGCHGGFDGQEITVDYRAAVAANLESRGLTCQE
jgi:hypothetical protein